MTQDEIIRMAREAGFGISNQYKTPEVLDGDGYGFITNELERFAALVAAHEREACAELFESAPNQEWSSELVAYQIRNMRRRHQSKE